jgi:hypothetical protein
MIFWGVFESQSPQNVTNFTGARKFAAVEKSHGFTLETIHTWEAENQAILVEPGGYTMW